MSRLWLSPILIVVFASSRLERVGRLDHPAIREASGLVKSRRHPGIFWVLNDSGNAPKIFAVRADGSLAREFEVNGINIDWEDIAIDDSGHLYIGDIGNNDGRLPIRAIHRLIEPNPNLPAFRKVEIDQTTFYRFAKGDKFDAESLVIDKGRALVIAKRFDGRLADIFELPLEPTTILKPALPKRLGTLAEFTEPATGASLSANGGRLAVCSYNVARVYERNGAEDWRLIETFRFEKHRKAGIEAIAWDGEELILAAENRDVYRLKRKKRDLLK